MGRAKRAMEYIKNDRARKTTFEKRKKGLKKKAQELATLCDVPLCVVIYQAPDSDPDTFPENRDHVRAVIDRYVSVRTEESSRRTLNLQSVLATKKRKADQQQLSKLGNKIDGYGELCNYPTWLPHLDGCCKEELLELAWVLGGKLQAVEERIQGFRAGLGNYNSGHGNAIVATNGDIQIGGLEQEMQWPMCVGGLGLGFAPMGGDGGSSSAGVGGASGGYYYDPNLYYGQVGPHGGGAGGSELSQPAMYGEIVRFEAPQGGLKCYEQGSFLY